MRTSVKRGSLKRGGEALATINAIHCAKVPFRVPQADSIHWLMAALERSTPLSGERDGAMNFYRRFLEDPRIGWRSSVVEDYTHQDWDAMRFFSVQNASLRSPDLGLRMQRYTQEATKLVAELLHPDLPIPDQLIEVSCTGYHSPHPGQQLLAKIGCHTEYLRIGHMGCYANFPALKTAAALRRIGIQEHGPESLVSVIAVELCSLHLNPATTTQDQMVANLLFADGAVRIDLGPPIDRNSLQYFDHFEMILPDTVEHMSWSLDARAFSMHLSRQVPLLILRSLRDAIDTFLRPWDLTRKDVSAFAIHPGGPKIIELIQGHLGLSEDAVRCSKEVLQAFGNMSSCSIVHIWDRLRRDPQIANGSWILSMGFGPGLTLCLNLLRKGSA